MTIFTVVNINAGDNIIMTNALNTTTDALQTKFDDNTPTNVNIRLIKIS
ncbi:hypothetical protein AB2063_002816 [Clostridium botulinum]